VTSKYATQESINTENHCLDMVSLHEKQQHDYDKSTLIRILKGNNPLVYYDIKWWLCASLFGCTGVSEQTKFEVLTFKNMYTSDHFLVFNAVFHVSH